MGVEGVSAFDGIDNREWSHPRDNLQPENIDGNYSIFPNHEYASG